jgi:hypothetical protein
VEAPGVEGRGEGSGFEGLREGSSGRTREPASLAVGDREAGGVSSGLAELRCSNEGTKDLESAAPSSDCGLPSCAADGPGPSGGANDDVRLLRARLVALEHVLQAVGALLDAGAIHEALSLVQGWRVRA